MLRARSIRSSWPYTVAVLFSALHFLGVILTVTAFVLFLIKPSEVATKVISGGVGLSGFLWMIAFFKRRSVFCPLCLGTPLINSGALAHSKATRIFPFNHGVSAILSIIATQRFCCMYCGADFDLLKIPSHLRKRQADNYKM